MENIDRSCCSGVIMSISQNFSSFKKMTTRAFSYLLDSPQQNPSLVAYTRYSLPYKYRYKRPAFLELDDEATQASADHEIRPVMHPKRPLVMNTGYAEVINAGKTARTNEDQSCFHSFIVTVPVNKRDETWTTNMCQIPCIYFSIFDGHAGTGAALTAYHNLHFHIKDKLSEISHMLVLTKEEMDSRYLMTGLITSVDAEKLIIGALENAFLALDEEIKQQRYDFRIDGGCTAICALIIKGQLYVANAGDCRAVVYKNYHVQLSTRDHNPESERKRIQSLALFKPQLLCDEYTRYQFQHRCRKKDVGTRQLYRDYNMDGWSLKMIDRNDLKPQVVCGEGKRARLLDTIGTTRGFGDHDLEVPYCANVRIKPFLLACPEVYVYSLENKEFTEDDVLIMASDGLWEKLSNENVGDILSSKLSMQKCDESRRYIVAAQGLVDEARGILGERGWRSSSNETASYDDISTFVIPLKGWKEAIDGILKLHREETGTVRRSIGIDEYLNIPHAVQVTGENCSIPLSNSTTELLKQNSTEIQNKKPDIADAEMPSFSINTDEMERQREKNELESISKSYDQVHNVELKGIHRKVMGERTGTEMDTDDVTHNITEAKNIELDLLSVEENRNINSVNEEEKLLAKAAT